MYALTQKSGHCMEKAMLHLYIKSFIANLYMTQKDQTFVVNVVVINLMRETTTQLSLINHQVQLWNLTPLLRSTSIEGFMKSTTLFQWPWRRTTHPCVIWIVSSGNVPIFFTIDNYEIIYPCPFAFKFSSSVLILLFNVL
jgi:hypothetical protein